MFAFLIVSALLSGCSGEPRECPDNELVTVYRDEDRDGFGDDARAELMCQARLPQIKYSVVGGDCDDTRSNVYPGAPETCDGLDNDCNGVIDDGLRKLPWYRDADGDEYGDPNVSIEACSPPDGYVQNNLDCDDNDELSYPGAVEFCDGKDNSCNGLIDDRDPETNPETMTKWYFDADRDGYGDPDYYLLRCDQPNNTVTNADDCDDTDPDINPDAIEICDGIDNNCNGHIDDSDASLDPSELRPFCEDADRDGYGNPDQVLMACFAPWFYVDDCTDCDDTDPLVTGGESTYWVLDADGDGFGAIGATVVGPTCTRPGPDYVQAGLALDCDDTNPDISPAAVEVCDGIDNNCNGLIDDADPGLDLDSAPVWYQDLDDDGFGNASVTQRTCLVVDGWVDDDTDCNDSNADVNPDAIEVCNGIDDNCSGLVDDADPDLDPTSYLTWYFDFDGDGWGDATITVQACSPPPGYVDNGLDCDDNDPDSGALITWLQDVDGDGFGAGAPYGPACLPPDPVGWVPESNGVDCDDTDPSAFPGAPEICGDGIDQSCSGADEPCPLLLPNTCAEAQAEPPLTVGTETFTGSLSGFTDNVSFASGNACTGRATAGADAIIPVTLAPNQFLRATHRNDNDAVLSLLTTCASPTPTDCGLGVDNAGPGGTENLWFHNGGPNTLNLFLVADCVGTCGAFDLEIEIGVPSPRFLPDTCAEAQPWAAVGTGGYAVRATNVNQTNSIADVVVCTGWQAAGKESLIPVEIDAGETIYVSYLQYTDDASIYLLPDCTSGPSCVAGADSTFSGQWESFTWTNSGASAARMYLVPDCWSSAANACSQYQLQFAIE